MPCGLTLCRAKSSVNGINIGLNDLEVASSVVGFIFWEVLDLKVVRAEVHHRLLDAIVWVHEVMAGNVATLLYFRRPSAQVIKATFVGVVAINVNEEQTLVGNILCHLEGVATQDLGASSVRLNAPLYLLEVLIVPGLAHCRIPLLGLHCAPPVHKKELGYGCA